MYDSFRSRQRVGPLDIDGVNATANCHGQSAKNPHAFYRRANKPNTKKRPRSAANEKRNYVRHNRYRPGSLPHHHPCTRFIFIPRLHTLIHCCVSVPTFQVAVRPVPTRIKEVCNDHGETVRHPTHTPVLFYCPCICSTSMCEFVCFLTFQTKSPKTVIS